MDKNLLSSLALFKLLYDRDIDIYTVIEEFIKVALRMEAKHEIDTTTMRIILEESFDINLPDSIIRTVLNRLVQANFLVRNHDIYTVPQAELSNLDEVIDSFEKLKIKYESILNKIIRFIERNTSYGEDENFKQNLLPELMSFINERRCKKEYEKIFINFFLVNEADHDIQEEINAVLEGKVIYEGIKYTPDFNRLSVWPNRLNIYLDTEILFHAVGYNGEVYRQKFIDFHNLVQEVNQHHKQPKNQIIHLHYLSSVKAEVEEYFDMAEKHIRKSSTNGGLKIAMKTILEGCKTTSDVVGKKGKFYSQLKSLGISFSDIEKRQIGSEYNLEDIELIKNFKEYCAVSEVEIKDDEIRKTLHIFSVIFSLRGQESIQSYEDSKHIIITGDGRVLKLANFNEVRGSGNQVQFATNLDFLTNKFWFKLKKGLGNATISPKSLDIVTRCQIVVCSQINNKVISEYKKLQTDELSGKISQGEAVQTYNHLRASMTKPEEVNSTNISVYLDFLEVSSVQEVISERDSLRLELHKTRDLMEKEKAKIGEEKSLQRGRKIKRISKILNVAIIIIELALMFGLSYLIKILGNEGWTLTLIALCLQIFWLLYDEILRKKSFNRRVKLWLLKKLT